jgi:hypothetical protein
MCLAVFFLCWFQVLVPFKANNEFEVMIDLNFKQKEALSNTSNKVTLDYTETVEQHNRKINGTPLPYLAFKIKFLTLSDKEERVKIVNNIGKIIYSKKAEAKTVIKLDVGYLDDVKDGVTPNRYDVILLDNNKTEVDMISILIVEDGTFYVNGEKRGKF